MTAARVDTEWLTSRSMAAPGLGEQLAACWRRVSDAGGAVGFPFPPVRPADVQAAVEHLLAGLDPSRSHLLVARSDGELAAWLLLGVNRSVLTAHWATVTRVQTDLAYRGKGVGRVLMAEVARAARDDLGLAQLHLSLRGGAGLESFYERFGWREVGRWPAALRLGPGDDRDDVLMVLHLG